MTRKPFRKISFYLGFHWYARVWFIFDALPWLIVASLRLFSVVSSTILNMFMMLTKKKYFFFSINCVFVHPTLNIIRI